MPTSGYHTCSSCDCGIHEATCLSSELRAPVNSELSPIAEEGPMDHREAEESLNSAGFSESERERLKRLRRAYVEKESGHSSTERQRLEFVRWLVSTGRLTDELA
jgi:hypothetical protein